MKSNPTLRKKTIKTGPERFVATIVKHVLIALFAFLCAGILFAFTMDQIFMLRILRSGSEIETPNLIGKTVGEAQNIIHEQHSTIIADSTEYNYVYPANTISSQYPVSGTKIKPGRRIRVTVSLGPRPIKMRNVVGKSRRDAELEIKALGLKVARQEFVHSNNYIRGIVARQYPEADQMIPDNTEVVLYVSDGLPETNTVMPNLINLGLSAAKDTLRVYKFDLNKVHVQTEEASELLPETVIDQHPDPGTPTNTKTVVDIVVSSPN
jgi:serine/threonine-protein kinase